MAATGNQDQAEAHTIPALSAGGIAEAAPGANHEGMAENSAASPRAGDCGAPGTVPGSASASPAADHGGIAAPGSPGHYELTAPEGFDVPAENLRGFSRLCSEAGITREQAEKVLGWHKTQHEQNMALAAREEAQTLQSWEREIMSDAEFGGSNWHGTLADARRALDRFDTDGSLREFLRETRFQHHPQVIRVVARVGRALGEHGFALMPGAQRADSELARLKRQYPSEFRS